MPIKIFESIVLQNRMLTSTVTNLKFSLPKGFTFKAGQYLSISRINEEGKKLRTPYSIATAPGSGTGEFCVKLVENGKASNFIKNLKEGDKIELFGPAGKFVVRDSSKEKNICFVSTGTGISAFASMIPSLLHEGFSNKLVLVKGFRDEEDVLYDSEFKKLEKEYSNFEFHNVLSQPKDASFENKGYVQDFLEKNMVDFKGDFYLCGLNEMINSVLRKLEGWGFDSKNIFFEEYD